MTQSQWEEGSSHFSRDILDIRLFSKDSGFSRMVEWAGARRIGIRWWKPYKDVAKASTRRRFHLGNLREHSIVAVITRIRGTDNFTYASSWPRSSIASNRNETASFSEFMRRRGGVDRYLSPSLSLSPSDLTLSLSLFLWFHRVSFLFLTLSLSLFLWFHRVSFLLRFESIHSTRNNTFVEFASHWRTLKAWRTRDRDRAASKSLSRKGKLRDGEEIAD